MSEFIPTPKKTTRTHANRILSALQRVYEHPDASMAEIIQAAKLVSEILERRPKQKRKTDKEKMLEAALMPNKKKKTFGGKEPK